MDTVERVAAASVGIPWGTGRMGAIAARGLMLRCVAIGGNGLTSPLVQCISCGGTARLGVKVGKATFAGVNGV